MARDADGIAGHMRLVGVMMYILESDRDLHMLEHLHSPVSTG